MELLHGSPTAVTTSVSSSWKRIMVDKVSQAPPDIMLHVGGCVFALHEQVLRLRWPWLHLQLQRLKSDDNRPISADSSQFKLRLILKDIEAEIEETTSLCPLRTITLLKPLVYTKCLAARHQRVVDEDEDLSSYEKGQEYQDTRTRSRGRKRRRQEGRRALRHKENEMDEENLSHKRVISLFDTQEVDMTTEDAENVLHVEVVGTEAIAMVPVIEYVYTFQVRLLHETSARQTLRLAEWGNMGDRLRFSCLKVAVRHVTLDTWMELLVATAALSREDMRRRLCNRMVEFLYELQPVQYQDAMEKIQTVWIQAIEDHDMLVRVVVALINNVRLVGFWRNLLDGLVRWLRRRFNSSRPPSLRTIHQHFVTDWEPYVELPQVECCTNTSSANSAPLHAALFEFGDFAVQICINAVGRSPLLWRVIRRTSPNFLSPDAEVVVKPESFAGDPEFWIRGQLIVKYQPANLGGVIVTEETRIEYQHCLRQYCKWKPLVSPSQSTLLPTSNCKDEGWVNHEDPENNYYRRTVCTVSGKLFIWGDPICSLYHQLLQTTLFYCAPNNVASEVKDILTVSEMQRLPVETLVLVFCSNRLRIPEGERTLLRCLNKMVFGLDVYRLEASAQLPRPYTGQIEDVARLYQCVHWCFVPLDHIIETLRWAPRELKLYEIVVKSLKEPNRSHKRRRPFGWRKFRDAYMTNETNLSEFEIEAGDLHLAPSEAIE